MINIPCPSCGCQYCEAETLSGEKVRIEICRCNDGSNEFDVTITNDNELETQYEKHQCAKEELESCLISRFNINIKSIDHKCSN
ncbi:hypothetical protein [Flavobacterium sp.]|uniref:hypothetical protein n=1 Tax=Flavobacterium sp. TaxID=239 RepID=UPI00261FBA51|nr:hypothetical protein [Flavobacterium sp.]